MSIIWTVRHKEHGAYRTAIKLSPLTRIHIFWRGDRDRSPHDHPNDFWTFPLRGYWEQVCNPATGARHINYVKPWRWHYRPAEYTHRVLGSRTEDLEGDDFYSGGFITIVRERPARRQWGFWVWEPENNRARWVYWRQYLGG
jgi:hypothetical protein